MGEISYDGQKRPLVGGKTIFDYADELAVQVPTSCGRTGVCHECIVEVSRGHEALSAPTEAEEFLRGNYRLACQAVIENSDEDVRFSLLRSQPKILTASLPKNITLDPMVAREGDNVCYDGEVIDRYHGKMYGLAVDLGTTTVVAELVDLETGEGVYLASFENPQRFGGSDIMHRISYDSGPFRGELHKSIVNTLNHQLKAMCRELGFPRHRIYEIVVVGNSTMRELFFGLDVQSIGQRPYKSQIEHEYLAGERKTTALTEKAHRLGIWSHPQAVVVGAPLIASHVGADMLADLVAVDIESRREVVMVVDVGTNTEVVLGRAGKLMAASCPAGPAFEGGLVTYGMPGVEGAIESLRLSNGQADYSTIGDGEPRGLCGSGLIDLLAELRRGGQMTPKGVFPNKARELDIVPEYGITLSRLDASNLAQAKAANYCGQFIVMRNYGVRPADITKLYLAGGFANYVNVRNAIEIGFLAPVPEDRIVKIGNAAALGAKEMLLSRSKRQSTEKLAQQIEHVELETTPDFFEIFVEACQFKPMPADFDFSAVA